MTGSNENVEKKSRQKYAELLCDFMFKRLFGSEANKDVLIGFLNMILEARNSCRHPELQILSSG